MWKMVTFVLFAVTVWLFAEWQVSSRESARLSELALQIQNLVGEPGRGEYVALMGGCVACHTDAANADSLLAGGVPIETPFGTFYSSNITSDASVGIGDWSMQDFIKAMWTGRTPSNQHYFPAFPYTSYSYMTPQDLVDLKAWLETVEPVSRAAPEHKLTWPFSFRAALVFWKAMYFNPVDRASVKTRGSYLVNGPGHCAECHAARNILGGQSTRSLDGNARGPGGEAVPGISREDLEDWTVADLELFLEVGVTPSGDFTGGHMADVVEYSTGLLTSEDRAAIALYLLSEANKR